MIFVKLIIGTVYILVLYASVVIADTGTLPTPEQVDHIRVQPHDGKIKDFYTPESLLQALPHLQETTLGKSLAFGKLWLRQQGIIYLKNGRELRWRSFTDNLLLIETAQGPVFYTDIQSTTIVFTGSKIIRTIYTWEAPKNILLETK